MTLIDPIDTSRKTARASALADARARGELGMQRVADKAERTQPGWVEDAVQALRRFANAQGGVWIVEHARLVLERELPPTSEARIWGVVTKLALKRGYIEHVKGQYFPAASSNNAQKSVYRRGAKA